MIFDRRHAAREPLTLPILLEGGVTAIIRDIGPQGLFIQMQRGLSICKDWVLHLELDLTRGLELQAVGEVLRVEYNNGGLGVALRLHSMRFLRRAAAEHARPTPGSGPISHKLSRCNG